MKTIIGIQQEYVDTVNAGHQRWAHRKDGGHLSRIYRGARNKATKALRSLGYTEQKQIDLIIKDAKDMAELERNAD